MWQKERGIILSAVRHSDNSSVVHLFTENHGSVAVIYHLAKSGRNTARNTLVQPLTQIEFDYSHIPSKSLQSLRSPKNTSAYTDMVFNPVKRVISLFLADYLTAALREEQPSKPLFDYLRSSLCWFDKAEKYSNFHLVFVLGVARHLGVCPLVESYREGFSLDLANGLFVKKGGEVPPELSYKTALLIRSDFESMHSVPLLRSERVAILHALNAYFKIHLPSFPTLKSIEVLETLFD